jgi:hypothetical protein
LQKAIRSLEINRYGLGFAKNFNAMSLDELMNRLGFATSERQFMMYEALRKGAGIDDLHHEDPYQGLVHQADAGTCGTGGKNLGLP